MPTARTLLRWSLGAVFVALGGLELFCNYYASDARSVVLATLKIVAGLAIAIGTPTNVRRIWRFFAAIGAPGSRRP